MSANSDDDHDHDDDHNDVNDEDVGDDDKVALPVTPRSVSSDRVRGVPRFAPTYSLSSCFSF